MRSAGYFIEANEKRKLIFTKVTPSCGYYTKQPYFRAVLFFAGVDNLSVNATFITKLGKEAH